MSYHSELCPDSLAHSPDSVSVQLPEEEDVVPSKREQCFNCCKKTTAFLCSTIGLTSMLVGYTIFGGFIFKELESPHEIRQKTTIKDSRDRLVEQLWNATVTMNVFYEKNWTVMAEELLVEFTSQVYVATKKDGWDGKDGLGDIQWTFAGSMLYSITVISTIGYGHIAPKTMWGRVVTIIYAMFGIPLCLLTLTNLGGFMATAFRFIYNNICCGVFCLCCSKRKERARVRSATLKYKDAGNGDPGAAEALTGVSSPDSTGSKASRSPRSPRSPKLPPKRKISTTVTWRSGLRRALKTEDNKSVSVPISVSFLLIAGYILSGAVLFTLWEKNWDYLEGTYFCFITLTTIGFGDFVPGTTQDAWNNQQKLVLCALYLLFGLALIAMCFDLMQEEVRNKVRRLGTKLGLINKEKKENLDNAPKATQTTSPAPPKPPKSSSSSSFKNFTLATPKPTNSKSKTSLNACNLDAVPEAELITQMSKKQKREMEKERKVAEKRGQEEMKQRLKRELVEHKVKEKREMEERKVREKRELEEQKIREKRELEEQKACEKREIEEQKAQEKRDIEERKLREKRDKEEKKMAAQREKEQLLQAKKDKEREKKEKSSKVKHKDKYNQNVNVDPVFHPTETYRRPDML